MSIFTELIRAARRRALVQVATALLLAVSGYACSRPSPTRLGGLGTLPTSPDPTPGSPGVGDPAPELPRTRRTRYLAFGDSITAGTTSPAVMRFAPMAAGLPESYPFKLHALLAARYAAQTIDVTNEGKPGEAAADGVNRFPGVLRSINPEIVLLMHGVNDVSFLGLSGVRTVAGHVDSMARQARLGGSEVVVCTYPPQRAGGFRASDPQVIEAYNEALREIARGEGAILVDFERDVDVRLMGMDGLHPTEQGFARMADILFTMIQSRFEVRP